VEEEEDEEAKGGEEEVQKEFGPTTNTMLALFCLALFSSEEFSNLSSGVSNC